MSCSDIHINTHLTGTDAIHLQELVQKSGLSTSEVLRAALQAYHIQYLLPKPNPVQLLSRFIASGQSEQDLSSRYKDYLSQELTHKHTSNVRVISDTR